MLSTADSLAPGNRSPTERRKGRLRTPSAVAEFHGRDGDEGAFSAGLGGRCSDLEPCRVRSLIRREQ
jgi:hypothetical protein